MSEKTNSVAYDELLSIESLLISRLYLYTLFHKAFGGEPSVHLLNLMASQTTMDVVDEYVVADVTMGRLKSFFTQLSDKVQDENYLDDVTSEYTYFFEGPAGLPAYPWEGACISHDATVFQKSTLVIRDAYRAYGLQVKRYKSVPDDHMSLMCAFLARLAQKSLDTFRAGQIDELRLLMADQYQFIHGHMNNWLPEYAKLACTAKSAYLYPQLAKGIEAFVQLDENFTTEVLTWICELSDDTNVLHVDPSCKRPAEFDKVQKDIEELAAVELIGLDENELVAIA